MRKKKDRCFKIRVFSKSDVLPEDLPFDRKHLIGESFTLYDPLSFWTCEIRGVIGRKYLSGLRTELVILEFPGCVIRDSCWKKLIYSLFIFKRNTCSFQPFVRGNFKFRTEVYPIHCLRIALYRTLVFLFCHGGFYVLPKDHVQP